MKLIYICARDVSVLESQVLALLSYLQSKGIDIYLLQGYKDSSEKENIERKLLSYPDLKVKYFVSFPSLPKNEKAQIRNIFGAISSVPNYQNAILHIRGSHTCNLVKRELLKRNFSIPILYDCRGVELEEHRYRARKGSLYEKILHSFHVYYSKYSYKQLFANDGYPMYITSVSSLINEYIKQHYPECTYPMLVHPNIAGLQFVFSNDGRTEIRNQLGYSDNDLVAICSTNGNAIWQKDVLTIQHFVNNGIKVINLSSFDPNIQGCTTIKVKFQDMPKYLSAADIAVLWRDNTFMNNSASPSKFSEFAAMGLYVVHNGSVAIASDFIKNNNAGCIVEAVSNIINSINPDVVRAGRNERVKKGLETFGIESLGTSYIKLYGEILKNN